jgi:hypothetical protein
MKLKMINREKKILKPDNLKKWKIMSKNNLSLNQKSLYNNPKNLKDSLKKSQISHQNFTNPLNNFKTLKESNHKQTTLKIQISKSQIKAILIPVK